MTAWSHHRLLPVALVQACLCGSFAFGDTKTEEAKQDEIRAALRFVAAESDTDDKPAGPAIATPLPTPPSPHVDDGFVIAGPDLYESTAPPPPSSSHPFTSPMYEEGVPYAPHRGRIRQYLENRPRQTPLVGDSWLNRPFSTGLFLGGMFADDPRPGIVAGNAGIVYGARLGWDFNVNWGVEGRLGIARPGARSKVGVPDMDNLNILQADMNWLWYPTGDTRWRPFFKLGFGYFDIDYIDGLGFRQHNAALEIPFGAGMKYHHSSRLTMRFDLTDDFACATGLQSSMHNLSVTSGFEWHWGGGSRRNYWPWNPGRDYR